MIETVSNFKEVTKSKHKMNMARWSNGEFEQFIDDAKYYKVARHLPRLGFNADLVRWPS
jgi:hypothetical protein